jgi:hypothetical protein
MPRDGALVLSNLRNPTLSIVCEPCGRRGTCNVARLMEQHGDAKLPGLLQTLADCPKARSASIHDRCNSKGWPYSPPVKARKHSRLAWKGRRGLFCGRKAIRASLRDRARESSTVRDDAGHVRQVDVSQPRVLAARSRACRSPSGGSGRQTRYRL